MRNPQVLCDLLSPGLNFYVAKHPGLRLRMYPVGEGRINIVGSYISGQVQRCFGFFITLDAIDRHAEKFFPSVEELVKRLLEGPENE